MQPFNLSVSPESCCFLMASSCSFLNLTPVYPVLIVFLTSVCICLFLAHFSSISSLIFFLCSSPHLSPFQMLVCSRSICCRFASYSSIFVALGHFVKECI